VLLLLLLMTRAVWKHYRVSPTPLATTPIWQQITAHVVHFLMSLSSLAIIITGYLMVTAKGDALLVFDWFSIPSLWQVDSEWIDLFGRLHLWIALATIGLASLHATAALKHHFIDKDVTLKRMLGIHSGDR